MANENDQKPNNVISLLDYKIKKSKKDLISCLYCGKLVDRTSWPVKTYMCNISKGTHEPYLPKSPE